MEHRELNHVALHVKDVAKSCEFYERVLELQPIPRPAFNFPGAWYQLGTAQELQLAAMARRISRGAQPLHRSKLRLCNRDCCCHDLAI